MYVADVQCGHGSWPARSLLDHLRSPLHVREVFLMLQGDDYKPCTTYAARFLEFLKAQISLQYGLLRA
jgi:hypothetical protein